MPLQPGDPGAGVQPQGAPPPHNAHWPAPPPGPDRPVSPLTRTRFALQVRAPCCFFRALTLGGVGGTTRRWFFLCLQSWVFSWGGGRMGTVSGRPPGSRRPLAGTMGSNTWHSTPPPHPRPMSMCFASWSGGPRVFPRQPRLERRLRAHLQAGTPHSGSQARARGPSGLVQVFPPAPSRHPAPDAGSGRLTSCPRALAPRTRRCVCSGPGMAGTRLSHNLPPPPGAQLGWGGGQ